MVLNASLRLFCLPCLVEGPDAAPFTAPNLESLRGCHRSADAVLPFPGAARLGLPDRDELKPKWSSSGMGNRSGWKAGNLKVAFGLASLADADVDVIAMAVGGAGGVSKGCSSSHRYERCGGVRCSCVARAYKSPCVGETWEVVQKRQSGHGVDVAKDRIQESVVLHALSTRPVFSVNCFDW